MSVYVDPMMACVPNEKWKWSENCHMFADTDEELHAFAESMGLKRAWHQKSPPASLSHYDLTRGMRSKALTLGAVSVDRQFVVAFKKLKAQSSKPAQVERAAPAKSEAVPTFLFAPRDGGYR